MASKQPTINSARLKTLLEGVNRFGFNAETGGYNRIGFSDADSAVRKWFAGEMVTSGLEVSGDQAGNLFGRLGPADVPCVMAGSHLDTVPEGGAFDGSLGACVALECARAMLDAGLTLDVPLVVAATSEEEGRFGGMLGSQAISGQLQPGWVEAAADADGISLVDAMRAQGLDPSRVGEATWDAGSIRAFVELHIEQGPVLESEGLSVGIVDGISGVCVLGVTLTGAANHSGTTPMDLRADAFVGLAETGAAIAGLIAEVGGKQSRITIGKVDLKPNFPHTIAGQAEFTVIIRDTDEAVMNRLREGMEWAIRDSAARNHLQVRIEERSFIAPAQLDQGLCRLIVGEAEALGLPHKVMPSGAGHDAQTMQAFCPSALIFVPSRGGISHAPEEFTDWPDIEKGAQLMLNALVRLVQEA
jgi:hydantoinase/carbamoylase family amidase